MEEKIIYNGIDLMKFVMAIVIVSIHVQLYTVLGQWYMKLQDHAVPLFFVFSSYFFFKKIRKIDNVRDIWKELWHFEKRCNSLYVFWIVALSPAILYWWHSEYLQLEPVELTLRFVKEYMLGAQFGASWFLGALIVGMPIVLCMIRLLEKIAAIFVSSFVCIAGGIALIISCLYIYIYLNECEDSFLYVLYEQSIRSPKMSFPAALPWLILGYLFSEKNYVEPFLKWLGVGKSVLLWSISFAVSLVFPSMSYIMLIAGVFGLFACSFNMSLRGTTILYRRLRIYSIHLFMMHFTMIFVVSWFMRGHTVCIFLITIFLCLGISELLIRLMTFPKFKWLIHSA